MRPRKLPNDLELLELEAAGLKHWEIGDRYNVSRQAVTKAFNNMDVYRRGAFHAATARLPWDVAAHPAREAIKDSEAFAGLRALVRERMGVELSDRSRRSLRAFFYNVNSGRVLTLAPEGPVWARRRDSDGDMVIRWPEGAPAPTPGEVRLFSLAPTGDDMPEMHPPQ
ncbi:hypothetical protein [Streptomyces sp. NPDC005955]|uniref:hypothetical protein n=1 Tax=Streptomyces sp. NPDC005955 TaxID=3364738 RepID=UPI0036BCA870